MCRQETHRTCVAEAVNAPCIIECRLVVPSMLRVGERKLPATIRNNYTLRSVNFGVHDITPAAYQGCQEYDQYGQQSFHSASERGLSQTFLTCFGCKDSEKSSFALRFEAKNSKNNGISGCFCQITWLRMTISTPTIDEGRRWVGCCPVCRYGGRYPQHPPRLRCHG